MYAMTVALPMYRARSIGWLALESLCAQEGVDFEWELIVMEEAGLNAGIMGFDPMGRGTIMDYRRRLEAAGCGSIKYVPLDGWIPLSEKWIKMGELSDSEDYLLFGADNYAPPNRLADTRRMLANNVHWTQCAHGMFYDIFSGSLAVYDQRRVPKAKSGICMGLKTRLVQNLPRGTGVRSGVDGWMFGCIERDVGTVNMGWTSELRWTEGLLTNGRNQISSNRGNMISNGALGSGKAGPYRPPGKGEPKTIHDCIPPDIVARILDIPNKEKPTDEWIR